MNQTLEPSSPVRLTYLEASTEKKQEKSSLKKMQRKIKQTEVRRENARDRMRETKWRHNISRMSNGSNKVNTFKNIIQSGPNFVCIVCNRCLYRKSVTLFSETQRKELLSDLFNFICSYDNKFYICKTSAKVD